MVTTVAKRDVSLRPVVAGTYILTQAGQRQQLVKVFEDDTTGDLLFRCTVNGQEVTQRVDELAEDVAFHRIQRGSDVAPPGWVPSGGASMVDDIGQLLNDAASSRQHLRIIEDEINGMLGSQTGDGSELADAVMAAVRDGVGSSIELADLAGQLRR